MLPIHTDGTRNRKRFPPLKVPAGFKATLFACDPLIEYPSSIALGPRANTLFVAADDMTGLGTTDIIQRDEVRLVEDTDGDGYADRAPVWADGFNSIQGLTDHDGTVFVMHAPYLTALRDADGDGIVDERKNLFKGFGLGPADDKVRLHNANGIVAGYGGWLYLALGDRGCDVVRPEGDLLVLNGGGILRCRLMVATCMSSRPGCGTSTRIEQRLDDVNAREAAADASPFRADLFSPVVQPMTLQTLRFLDHLKQLATAFDVTGARQRGFDESFVFADNQGKKHSLRKADIEESKAHLQSIMPDGLEKSLSLDEFVDLIAFLTSEKQTTGR